MDPTTVGFGGDFLLPAVPPGPCLPVSGPLRSFCSGMVCEPGASAPPRLFIFLRLTCLPFPSVSSDLVQRVLPCFLDASRGMPHAPPLPFSPLHCWGMNPGPHASWARAPLLRLTPHFRLVLSITSAVGTWLMIALAFRSAKCSSEWGCRPLLPLVRKHTGMWGPTEQQIPTCSPEP